MQAAANRLQLSRDTSVYLIRPTIDYRSTERVYADEYGSLSADAQWGAVEMFRAAMRRALPERACPKARATRWQRASARRSCRTISSLDLRELKNQGERASAEDYRFATLTTSGSM